MYKVYPDTCASYRFTSICGSIPNIVSEINITKTYKPKKVNIDLLLKRYSIWKDLYKSNNKIAQNLNF